MTTPKRHHYVPEMLQKRFVDEEGKIFFFNKSRPENGVRSTKPKAIFAEVDLYTEVSAGGAKDTAVEKWLSMLEGAAKQVTEQIVTVFRAGRTPHLDENDRNILNLFMCVQFKRVPDYFTRMRSDDELERIFAEVIADALAKFPERHEEIAAISQIESKNRLKKNTRARVVAHLSDRVMSVMNGKGLVYATPSSSKKSFIIGSNPVVRMGANGIIYPDSEMWMPLSPDVMVGLMDRRYHEQTVRIPDHLMRRMNEQVAKQSTIIAGHSEALICSLANSR